MAILRVCLVKRNRTRWLLRTSDCTKDLMTAMSIGTTTKLQETRWQQTKLFQFPQRPILVTLIRFWKHSLTAVAGKQLAPRSLHGRNFLPRNKSLNAKVVRVREKQQRMVLPVVFTPSQTVKFSSVATEFLGWNFQWLISRKKAADCWRFVRFVRVVYIAKKRRCRSSQSLTSAMRRSGRTRVTRMSSARLWQTLGPRIRARRAAKSPKLPSLETVQVKGRNVLRAHNTGSWVIALMFGSTFLEE